MQKGYGIEVKDGDPQGAIREVLGLLLERDEIVSVLGPMRLPTGKAVMPTLVAETRHLADLEPLTPAFPMNNARILSRLSRKEAGGKTAVLLRPCELRAFVELMKLHQGAREELLLISMDCPGAVTNRTFSGAVADKEIGDLDRRFVLESLKGVERPAGLELAAACRVCEHMTPVGADMAVGLFGLDAEKTLWIAAETDAAVEVLSDLGLAEMKEPEGRAEILSKIREERIKNRNAMFERTSEATKNIEALTSYLGPCVNCYNCRVACPVCYCRECVFVTDVFEHEPRQYLNWARRKGALKMPTDTVFYHLTRLAHMSLSCVGCGQCSNACPNDIPVMELFRTLSHHVQKSFDYQAGLNPEQAPPLAEFKENELAEVVGL